MSVYILIEGILIGFMVAVPVGPLGLLCISRTLRLGPVTGLFSGLGVATGDALAAAIAALGISLVSDFLIDHQIILRLMGGAFLVYLGAKIYKARPLQEIPASNVNGLLAAYATTLFLTLSNPATFLSFIAIYAGWHVESMSGRYVLAATLALGVFIGSALWWVALFLGLTTFRESFNLRILAWVHRLSGIIIAGFGVIVLLSLSPLRTMLGFEF
jgi:threonine/homoserine/homoserine lactone efflux protein